MTWPRKLPLEKRIGLVKTVQIEIRAYKSGSLDYFTPNYKLAEQYKEFGLNGVLVSKILYGSNQIDKKDLHLRASSIISQQNRESKGENSKRTKGRRKIEQQLLEIVSKEITNYKQDEINRLTTNYELAKKYLFNSETIGKYLAKLLTKEEREYRDSILLLQQYKEKGTRKVTQEQVNKMRELHSLGLSLGKISLEVGLSKTTVKTYVISSSPAEYKEQLAKRNGYNGHKDYVKAQVKNKGFKSKNEYEKSLLAKRGFKNRAEYEEYKSKLKGFNSAKEMRKSYLKKRGFESWRDYKEQRARENGFKTWQEYRENFARERGFDSYSVYYESVLRERGFSSMSDYLTQNIRKRGFQKNNHYIKHLAKKNGTLNQLILTNRIRARFNSSLKAFTINGKIKPINDYGIDMQAIIERLQPFPDSLVGYHVDHIIPLSAYDLEDEEEIKKAWSPLNLRWARGKENQRKKDKILEDLIQEVPIELHPKQWFLEDNVDLEISEKIVV